MGQLDKERAGNALQEGAFRQYLTASLPRQSPCNDTAGHVVRITAEEQAKDARAVASFVERMFALPDEDPPGAWEDAMRDLDAQRPFRKLFEGLL